MSSDSSTSELFADEFLESTFRVAARSRPAEGGVARAVVLWPSSLGV